MLSACGKQLQHVIHSAVTSFHLKDASNVEAVLTGDWPQLALVEVLHHLWPVSAQHFHLPQASKFQLIASVKSRVGDVTGAVLVVSTKPQVDHPQSIETAFSRLSSDWEICWDFEVTIHSQAEAVVAQLAQRNWQDLRCLGMPKNKLGHAAMTQLAKYSWEMAVVLDLSNNQLDEAAMTALSKGGWPCLRNLILDANQSLSATALAVIPTAATWVNLEELSLAGINLDKRHICSILPLHNQLHSLNLAYTGVDAAALSQIASSTWPCLQWLSLNGNRLTANAMASLALAGQMPELYELKLSDNHLDAGALQYVVKGSWCKLRYLHLDNNQFNDAAMAYLAIGHWPDLCCLTLYGNDISVQGVQLLTAGQWPWLQGLILDSNAICIDMVSLLNLVWGAEHDYMYIGRPGCSFAFCKECVA